MGILKTGDAPKSLDYWQGRKEEIIQLHQWLADENIRLIGIEGIGGTGKSMLATKIYEEIPDFPKRFWADVSSGATIFSDLARRVLTDFGETVPDDELKLVNALVQCLRSRSASLEARSRQYLLIIDNLETLLDSERNWKSQFYEEFFRTWLEHGKSSKIIVTTRERPNLRGFEWLPLKGLKTEDGAALLEALGIQGELSAFAKLVDGHPLLLKIVANLIKEEYPQDPNLERLTDLGLGNLRELLSDPRVVGSHRTKNVGMVLVLDASFERLADWQKIWLQNLSIFRVAFDAEAAIAMFPKSDELSFERNEAEQELRKLVKRSFLEEQLNPQRQFSFQPVILEYLRYKAGDQTTAHGKALLLYYHSKVEEESWQTIDDLKEYLEIYYHFSKIGEYDLAFDMIRACNDFLNLRGYYTVLVELYENLIIAWQQTDIDIRDKSEYIASLILLGSAHHSLGHYKRAIELHLKSLELARKIGNRSIETSSLGNLGNPYFSLGHYDKAIEVYQKSLELAQEIGNQNLIIANSLGNLGNVYSDLAQYEKAIKFCQQSLDIFHEIGNRTGEADCLQNLANTYYQCGRAQEGLAASYQAGQILQDLELPLEAMPYPKWIKSLVQYAQRGKFQLFLCFLFGLIAFPFALVFILFRLLWLLTKRLFRR